jgi:hypothetical protein
MTKLVAVVADNVEIRNRFSKEDFWTCIIGALACAAGMAAGFVLAALV